MADKEETLEDRAARIAKAREEVAAFDREQAEAAHKEHLERVEPLQKFVDQKAYATFMEAATQLREEFVRERRVYALLDGIIQAGEALPRAVQELASAAPAVPVMAP